MVRPPFTKRQLSLYWAVLALSFSLLFVALSKVAVISAPTEDNMLSNPGFEEPDPANWESKDPSFLFFWTYSWVSNPVHSGSHAVGIEVNWESYEGWWQSTPSVQITPTMAYTFSGWIKTEAVGNQATLALVFLDAEGREVMERYSGSASGWTDWTRVYPSEPVVAPVDAVYARVRCRLLGTGKAWFDDVLLRPARVSFADLEISKKADPVTISAGERLTYTLVYSNVGNAPAKQVVITDTLPLSVTIVHVNPPADAQPSPNVLVWKPSDPVESGEAHTITVSVTVSDTVVNGQWLTNTVTVVGANADSATAWITTEVTSFPKLVIEKRADTRSGWVSMDDTLRYTLTYRNVGGAAAVETWLTDTLPMGVTYLPPASISPTEFLSISRQLVWNVGLLEANSAEKHIVITVTVGPSASGKILRNCAEITDGGTGDTACEDVWVYPPNLRLMKYADPAVVRAGERLTYTLVYSNAGSGQGLGVIITDLLPSGVELYHATPRADRQPNDHTLVWDVGDLVGNGMPYTITLVVTVSSGIVDSQLLTNTAEIASENATSVTAAVTTTVLPASTSLDIEKRARPSEVGVGELLTYTLVYRNIGDVLARSVIITDVLPEGVEGGRADPPESLRPDPRTLVWNVGDLAGRSSSYTITFVVTASRTFTDNTLVNSVMIGAKNAGLVTDVVTTSVSRLSKVYLPVLPQNYAAPSLRDSSKGVDKTSASPGEELTYTIWLFNAGTSESISATLTDTIPARTTFIPGSLGGGGWFSDGQVHWEGTLGPKGVHTVSFQVRIDDYFPIQEQGCICSTPITNEVEIQQGGGMVITPTAVTQVQLCSDEGTFETGWDGWMRRRTGNMPLPERQKLEGNYVVRLGHVTYNCGDRNVPGGQAWIEKWIKVPSTPSPKLFFRYRMYTFDKVKGKWGNDRDYFEVMINGESRFLEGNTGDRYGCKDWDPDLGWKCGAIDLSRYKGKQVKVRFRLTASEDGWFTTWVYVDDIRVRP